MSLLKDPVPVESINWEEDDTTPWALRCADESAAQALEWVYGSRWRDQRLRLIDAAIIMVCSPNGAWGRLFQGKISKRGSWQITYGMVFDYQRRRNNFVSALDYDTIQEWSREHKFSLARHRWLAIRFLRAAYAARTAGLPIEEAEFTMHQWDWWGIDRTLLSLWQGRPENPKWWFDRVRYAPYRMRDGQRRKIRVYNVSDLLEYFLLSSITTEDATTDVLRDRYRMVAKGCKRFIISLQHAKKGASSLRVSSKREKTGCADCNQWRGALGLQRAWNAYHVIAQIETGSHVRGHVAITPRRINFYTARALQLLAETDPDWTRQPLDTSAIQPGMRYAVMLPSYGAIETPMMVHTPAGAQPILVLHSATQDVALKRWTQSRGYAVDRVAYTDGAHIIAHPYAYTR